MKTTKINTTQTTDKGKHRSTFAILFYINRTKIRKDGMCQLLCNISIDAESEQIGTKVSVDPCIWNPKEGRASGRSQNALTVNRAIDRLTEQIKRHYQEIKLNLGVVTATLVKNAIKGIAQAPSTLMKLFAEHNEEFKRRVGVDRGKAASQVYKLSCKHLLSFLQRKFKTDDVMLRSLDLEFIDAYDLYLRTDLGMQQKTIHHHLYILKKMSKRAVSQGTLRRDPFLTVHPPLPPLRSRHLKIEDLERLMQSQIDVPKLQRVRDWFVFSTFTGLAFADLKKLSTQHLRQYEDGHWWIHIKRQKTGTDSTVRLMEIPLQIIEKYSHERTGDLIFNIYARSTVTKLIQTLGNYLGIKGLTFHKARHNFGTHITLSQGVPIETVSRMMGHKSITTTQIYAKVTDRKVAEDMKQLKARISGKEDVLYEDEKFRDSIRYPQAK